MLLLVLVFTTLFRFSFLCVVDPWAVGRGADKCQWDGDKARELSVRVRKLCECMQILHFENIDSN